MRYAADVYKVLVCDSLMHSAAFVIEKHHSFPSFWGLRLIKRIRNANFHGAAQVPSQYLSIFPSLVDLNHRILA